MPCKINFLKKRNTICLLFQAGLGVFFSSVDDKLIFISCVHMLVKYTCFYYLVLPGLFSFSLVTVPEKGRCLLQESADW